MRYVAAYLLAVLGGNAAPSNADIEKILSSVGIEADSTRVTKVVNELKGKSVEELIASGREKLSSMPRRKRRRKSPNPRRMTTWASVSLNKGFPRGHIAGWLLVAVAMAFLPPKGAGRHCSVLRFRKCTNYLFL
ncbi:hypothetical protein pipiens_004482 [Culex pipiens pipiens]|uniref:Large ribosomal subunit protein P2 n=1 Tax=Culex pipiens pipiens TaxID=38569 RepID=A0ABD1CIG8_CULPP